MERLSANFNWQNLPMLLTKLVELVEAIMLSMSRNNLREDQKTSQLLAELKEAMAEFKKEKE